MPGLSFGAGEVAALSTALAWSGCANAFGAAGRRVGSVAVNHLRLVLALVLLTLLHAVILGSLAPLGLSGRELTLFAASGVVGLTLGDASGFRGLVLVGPALVTLVFTLVPALASLLAWIFLGETVAPLGIAGMAVTLAGLLLAVRTRTRTTAEARAVAALRGDAAEAAAGPSRAVLVTGLAFALGGALGQAGGLVLARPALANASPLSGTWVRLAAATVVLWAFTVVRSGWTRRRPAWLPGLQADRRALLLIGIGTVAGPVVGVWMSQVATKLAPVAIAATLMSLTPIFVLLGEWAFAARRPRAGEVLGASLAVAGVALLVASRSSGAE